MKARIKENINDAEKLEQLYHDDKSAFEKGFGEVYPELERTGLTEFWKIRLNYNKLPEREKKISLQDILILISACLVPVILIRIPDIFNIADRDIFYMKNAGIIIFFGLTIYVTWVNKVSEIRKLVTILISFLILTVYVNLLPSVTDSDSVNLVFIHLPLLVWCIFGLVCIDFDLSNKSKRTAFIRYNGDLAILIAIIAIAGGILTAITIGLFDAIGINIENFYMENVVIAGVVAVPIVATYITKYYSVLTNKIAPVIAGIFSPLVLLTAIVFLAALAIAGKDPYSDREFLLVFNIMLLGVMAVIVFSTSETSISGKQKFNEMVLLALSITTVVIDLIALSAIFYRLGTFGITPNRLAVLGSNILILVNLIMIIIALYKVNVRKALMGEVELAIARYLPVYIAWIVFVVFAFPLIFGMK